MIVWEAAADAPSGGMIASAQAVQNSGPGTASVITTVSLGYAKGRAKPVDVLVLENPSAADIAALRVDLTWRDARHLEIVYPRDATLDFRANLFGNITIESRPR